MTAIRRRTRARELVLQFLYSRELRGEEAFEDLEAFVEHHTRRSPDRKGADEVAKYALRVTRGVREKQADIDLWIEHIASNWTIDRMAVVDRSVLRLGLYELLHCSDVPFKVVINEAIDLAKRFSTENSGSFVNGILDQARILIEQQREAGADLLPPPKMDQLPGTTEQQPTMPELGIDEESDGESLEGPLPGVDFPMEPPPC